MPRYRKNTATTEQRIRGGDHQRARISAPWVDPFPEVHGTLPEKMVYAELTRRGIPFLFLNDLRMQIPEIDFDQWYQADFAIPDVKVIIEVQGAYWHSKPETIDADAYKFAVYQTTGWKPVAWWDYDIQGGRLMDLFEEVPELAPRQISYGGRSQELPVQRRTKVDTSKGIRTLNARRARGKMATYGRRTVRKASSFYAT